MEQVISNIGWPVVAIVFLFIFRAPLTGLICRIRSVSTKGVETFENQLPQPVQATNEMGPLEEFLRGSDNPALTQTEDSIRRELTDRRLEAHGDRETALIRSLAMARIQVHFEQTYAIIWASQIAVLRALNSRPAGFSLQEIHPAYDLAKNNYPAMYENYLFEQWLAFMQTHGLVIAKDENLQITDLGRYFLQYIAAASKQEPLHG